MRVRDGVGRWASKGPWAVADQGLFSAGNLVLNVLLARWLPADEYGAFSVAFAVFVALSTVHTAMITEPVLVFGPGAYATRLESYLRALLTCHWLVGLSLGAGLALVTLALAGIIPASVRGALLAMAAAVPFVLLVWFLRRVFYVRSEPRVAALSGLLNVGLVTLGVLALRAWGALSAVSGAIVLGLAGAVVGAWLAWRLRLGPGREAPVSVAAVLRTHGAYGRWAVGNAALVAVPASLFLVALSAWRGLEPAGALRALMNVTSPALQTGAALATLLLPSLVRVERGPEFGRLVRIALVLCTAATGAYWLLVSLLRDPVVALAYGGRYRQEAGLLWVLGLAPVFATAEHVLSVAHKAVGRVDRVFWCWMAVTLVAVPAGLEATSRLGLAGATGASVGHYLAAAAAAWLSFRRLGLAGPHPARARVTASSAPG